ncbi:MAG: hypothetical protein OEZ36_12330 [Spirochaetota bacterium]|nr:hypothetical protein [Spirochaetota bacterium]
MINLEVFFSVIGYVPLTGWMIPLYGKQKSKMCQFHGKQSLAINAFFLFILSIWWIIGSFIPVSHDYVEDIILYIALAAYGLSLVIGGLSVKKQNLHLAIFERMAHNMKL